MTVIDRQNSVEIGQEVIDLEVKGLKALSASLGEAFAQAVDLLRATKGRVITTGMGKSGHIARKIAASFSSTGTPSFYLHPAEASHGDLGMIAPQDTVMALSNSGETRELADIISYAGRHGNPLIGITQGEDSALALASTLILPLPAVMEACPNGLAPTTSTTMMLALGDALAIALLKSKCFSKEDFKSLHPGGNLGVRLKRIRSIMRTGSSLPLVDQKTPMSEALLIMTSSRNVGCVGAVDEQGVLVGVITDGDLRRHMSSDLLNKKVQDIMTQHPRTIQPDALVEEALHRMEGAITSLFVIENNLPIGLVHIHDLLRLGLV